MKKLAAALLTVTAAAVAPIAVAPVAQADICAGARGRHSGWAAAPMSPAMWRPA